MSLHAEPGVRFDVIAAAGFRILEALSVASRKLGSDLVVTSACDGDHSGPLDPHKLGCAYDVRSHDFVGPIKQTVLNVVMHELAEGGVAIAESDGLVTNRFFGWLEQPGAPNEHYHFQLRHGIEYP